MECDFFPAAGKVVTEEAEAEAGASEAFGMGSGVLAPEPSFAEAPAVFAPADLSASMYSLSISNI